MTLLCQSWQSWAWSLFMPIVSLLITLVVVGVILWLINNYLPMDGKIKSIINIIVVIAVIIWLLQSFGILGGRIA